MKGKQSGVVYGNGNRNESVEILDGGQRRDPSQAQSSFLHNGCIDRMCVCGVSVCLIDWFVVFCSIRYDELCTI